MVMTGVQNWPESLCTRSPTVPWELAVWSDGAADCLARQGSDWQEWVDDAASAASTGEHLPRSVF